MYIYLFAWGLESRFGVCCGLVKDMACLVEEGSFLISTMNGHFKM